MPRPPREAIESALAESAELESIQQRKPRWEDYVDEGVLEHEPEPGAGRSAKIEGHERVKRMLEMNEEANRLAGERADRLHAERRKTKVRGPRGETVYVREERAEQVERKHHRPRTSIVVPEMPWKRDQ